MNLNNVSEHHTDLSLAKLKLRVRRCCTSYLHRVVGIRTNWDDPCTELVHGVQCHLLFETLRKRNYLLNSAIFYQQTLDKLFGHYRSLMFYLVKSCILDKCLFIVHPWPRPRDIGGFTPKGYPIFPFTPTPLTNLQLFGFTRCHVRHPNTTTMRKPDKYEHDLIVFCNKGWVAPPLMCHYHWCPQRYPPPTPLNSSKH